MKRLIFFLLALSSILNLASAEMVLMVIAKDGFRDEELFVPKEIFETNGVKVVIASKSRGLCKGMLGHEVLADLSLSEVNVDDYDAVIFVGGIGSKQYWDDPVAHQIINDAYKKGKIIAGICLAPVTLGKAGVLKNKRATVWRGAVRQLEATGAIYTGSGVEVDGNIITADGPGSAQGFGEAILKKLRGNAE